MFKTTPREESILKYDQIENLHSFKGREKPSKVSEVFQRRDKKSNDDTRDEKSISHYNASIMNPDPPALYFLNTESKYIDGNDKKLRQWTYGSRDRNKQSKVILLVGETGAGKTTIANTMINYLLGVKFEDEEFYQITGEEEKHEDQTQSQTSEINVYEVFAEENPTSLTIIDTPGYANTEGYKKDREISKYLSKLFADEDGIHYIDAVCFVMKATQGHFSDKEHYIFHSVLSLFGRDIENNIVFLLTHSDGRRPRDVLNAINTAKIPCRRDENNEPVHFLFNNQQKEKRVEQYESVFKSSWEIGDKSMNDFSKRLVEMNRKGLQMTLDVLKERRQLEACVSNLKEQISDMNLKMNELNHIQEALRQNRDKIKKCENFKFTVKKTVKEKALTENVPQRNRKATCCNVCEENCHENCRDANDLSKCSVMKNSHCTMCTGRCHYSKHVKENTKYVMNRREIEMTFADLKQEYESIGDQNVISFDKKKYENIKKEHDSNLKESENKRKAEEKLKRDLEKNKSGKSNLLHEAYMTIVSLSKFALKADSAFTLQHLGLFIPKIEEEKNEWMKDLEDLRKAGEEQKNKGALHHLMDITRQ